MSKKSISVHPHLPLHDRVFVGHFQYFDNSHTHDAKQGHSTRCVRVMLWCSAIRELTGSGDWWRNIQMLSPSVFKGSVDRLEANGKIADRAAYDALLEWAQPNDEFDWFEFGHVWTPPGKTYYPNEFLVFGMRHDGTARSILMFPDHQIIDLDMRSPKTRKNDKAPHLYAVHDPYRCLTPPTEEEIEESRRKTAEAHLRFLARAQQGAA